MADLKISQLTGASTPLAGTEVVPLVQSSTTKKVSVANLTAGRTVDVAVLLANSTSVDGNWKVQTNASASGLAGIGVNNNGGYGAYLIYDNSGRYAGGGAAIRNIANTPIYIETNNTIVGQFDTSGNYVPATAGKGINFTANTNAPGMTSELLNWYEEGTWTPVLTPSTSGSITLTSPTNSMRYTRVGRLVTLTGLIDVASVSSPVGDLRLTGIPFNVGGSGAGSVSVYGLGTTSTATAYQVLVDSGSATTMFIRGYNAGSQVATVANNVQGGSGFYLTIQYTV
jgi:hypothetical protein